MPSPRPSESLPGIFHRWDPAPGTTPIPLVVDVSRSGREYPHDFRSPAPFTDVHDNVSMYVEELWDTAPRTGATMLYCCFPNIWVDTNRHVLDIDPELVDGPWTGPEPLQPGPASKRGLGLFKKVTRWGKPMHEKPLSMEEIRYRIDSYHTPYHAELERMVEGLRQAHGGRVWNIGCHCMSAVGAPTHPDPGQPRADFCLGNNDGTTSSANFIGFVEAEIKRLGHSVTVNFPYKGGELNRRYGGPERGRESIMVEINKRLFMDTKTFKRTEGFVPLKRSVDVLMARIADYVRENAGR